MSAAFTVVVVIIVAGMLMALISLALVYAERRLLNSKSVGIPENFEDAKRMKTIFLLFEHEVRDGHMAEPGTLLNPYITLPGAKAAAAEQAVLEYGHNNAFATSDWSWDEKHDRWVMTVGMPPFRPARHYTILERSVVNA